MEIFGLREASRQIGISPGALRWQLCYGRVADITLRAPNGARLFTPDDVQRLRTALNPNRNPAAGDDVKREQGNNLACVR